jgi:hypothetical protein
MIVKLRQYGTKAFVFTIAYGRRRANFEKSEASLMAWFEHLRSLGETPIERIKWQHEVYTGEILK